VAWEQLFLQLRPSLIMPSNKGYRIMFMGRLPSLSLSLSPPLPPILGCYMHVQCHLMHTQPIKLGWSTAPRFICMKPLFIICSLSLPPSLPKWWYVQTKRNDSHSFIYSLPSSFTHSSCFSLPRLLLLLNLARLASSPKYVHMLMVIMAS